MLFPLYSILRQNEGGFARPAAQVVMLHLKRVHLMEWVRAVMAVALGAAAGEPLPPLVMQREQDDLWSQPSALCRQPPCQETLSCSGEGSPACRRLSNMSCRF
jgi:hypothetical protein